MNAMLTARLVRNLPRQRGFTLLEVLIALTLMAVLSILSWRALDTTARSSERLEARADDTMALLRVLGQVESDISRHAGADVLTLSATPPDGADPTPLAAALPPGILWRAPRLTVLRATHDGGWQEVVWTLAGDTLMRAAGAPSTHLPLPPAQAGEAMLAGVRGFAVRAWLPGQGWSEAATAASANTPATGLEIAIARTHDGVDETYRKVVPLP